MKKAFVLILMLAGLRIFAGDTRYNENLNMPQDTGGGGNVSVQTGNLSIGFNDLSLPGLNGLNFSLQRSYSSALANTYNMACDSNYKNLTTTHTPADWKYGLGSGWTFGFPFLFRDIDDKSEIQKLNLFWGGSVYEVDQSLISINNKDQSNLMYYYVSDMRIYTDTSMAYSGDETDTEAGTLENSGVRSKYCLELKDGTKYYFTEAGNLMLIRKPKDTSDVKYAEIWFYYKKHETVTSIDQYEEFRDEAKIELVIDSIGNRIDFVYKAGSENWLEEVKYTVTINNQTVHKSIKYSHENLSVYDVYAIDEENKTIKAITKKFTQSELKYSLSGFINQMNHLTKYEYSIVEAVFSFLPSQGNNNNYFVNLTAIHSNYRVDNGEVKKKNSIVWEYNRPMGSDYIVHKRNFSSGFMSIFKVSREYALNKYGETFNSTWYEYFGNNWANQMIEYWTIVKIGNLEKKYVYSASNKDTEDNLLKYEETEANAGSFLERKDYVYDIRKTLKSITMSRSGVEKYTESFVYDIYNDLINHKAPNGLITETKYHAKFHAPVHSIQRDIKNGDGTKFDVEIENQIRDTDGKVLSETVYATVNGARKGIKAKTYTYDIYGNPIVIKDALGNTVKTYYDDVYHIYPQAVEMTVTLDGVVNVVKGFKLFNTDGSVWIEADNDGYAIEHIYDELGTEIKKIMPDENDQRNVNDIDFLKSSDWRSSRLDNGYVEMEVDYEEEIVTTYGEIFNGKRVKTAKFGDGLSHIDKEVLYEDENSDIEYSVKKMKYDANGNMIALTDPDAGETFTTRNIMGKDVDVYDKTWIVEYDDLKRKVKVEYPDDSGKIVKKTISYNDRDLIVTTTNTRRVKVIEYYDIDGNLIKLLSPQVKDENGTAKDLVYTFEYNQLKQRTAFTQPNKERVSYKYDERGLLLEQDYTNGKDIMTYNDNGNLITKKDRNENLIKFYYDEMGRNIKQDYFVKTDYVNPNDYITLGYDGRGNLTKVDSNKLLENMSYDSRARLMNVERTIKDASLRLDLNNSLDWVTTDDLNQKFTFSFTYTPNNLVRTMTMPNGKTITYAYDEDKLRLSNIDIVVNQNNTRILTDIQYNKGGQVVSMSYNNNTTQEWEFDLRKRIKNIEVKSQGVGILRMDYKLDTEGNILSINDNVFEYDELNRLIKSEIVRLGEKDFRVKVGKAFGTSILQQSVGANVWDEEADLNIDGLVDSYDHVKACQDWRDKYDREAFTYDFNGNRTKLVQNTHEYKYFYGEQNKLLKIEKSSKLLIEFEYDNNGNTIKKTEYNEDNTKTIYNYNYDFNNRLIEVLKNSVAIAKYIYDNAGLRLYKEENAKRTYYFRNGQSVNYEVEIDDTKNEVAENTYIMSGELIAGRVERKNAGTETVVYYHLDHLNSTKIITDQSGTVVLTYEYRAFGTELDKVGTDENKFSYIGREFDEEINLYYFNARYYDATLGRFINVDPIQDGLNWYVYCNNNPLSFKDPTGLRQALNIEKSFWLSFFDHYLPKKFLNNYMDDSGKPIKLTKQEMIDCNAIVSLKNIRGFDKKLKKWAKEGRSVDIDIFGWGGAKTNGTLGNFSIRWVGTITFDKNGNWSFSGKMAFADKIDFDPKEEEKGKETRSDAGEFKVKVANLLIPGKPFYVISEEVDVKQTSSDKLATWEGNNNNYNPQHIPDKSPKDIQNEAKESRKDN